MRLINGPNLKLYSLPIGCGGTNNTLALFVNKNIKLQVVIVQS